MGRTRVLLAWSFCLLAACGAERRVGGGGSAAGGGDGAVGPFGGPGEGEGEGEGEGGLGGVGEGEGDGGGPGGAAGGAGDPEAPPVCSEGRGGEVRPSLDLTTRCRANGESLRIRDLRNPACPDYEELPTRFPGREVTLDEAVVTGVFGNDFTVQDTDWGTYSALWVYDAGPDPAEVRVGQRVRLRGTVIEFYTLTEMSLSPDGGLEILGSAIVPPPLVIVDPARIADGGDLVEQLESQIVELRNVEVRSTVPDCPRDFHMFQVDGRLRVANDDPPLFDYEPARGDVLTRVVGAVHYSFEHQKLLPRGDEDVDYVRCGGVPDKCEATECPVPEDAPETGRLVLTEIQDNPEGDDSLREFVEIYNPGPDDVDLGGWALRDCADRGVALAGVLPAGEHHVIAASTRSDENGGVPADADLGDLFLPNGFGEVLLYTPDGALVDQVRYRVGGPWPERHAGQALELPEPAADNRNGASWRAAEARYGDGGKGSPGRPAAR